MAAPAAGRGPGEEEEEEEEEEERAGDRRLCRAGSGAGAGRGRPLAARPQGAAEAAGARPPLGWVPSAELAGCLGRERLPRVLLLIAQRTTEGKQTKKKPKTTQACSLNARHRCLRRGAHRLPAPQAPRSLTRSLDGLEGGDGPPAGLDSKGTTVLGQPRHAGGGHPGDFGSSSGETESGAGCPAEGWCSRGDGSRQGHPSSPRGLGQDQRCCRHRGHGAGDVP